MRTKKVKLTLLDAIVTLLILAVVTYIVYRLIAKLNYKWNWTSIPMYLFRYDEETGSWTSNLLMQGLYNTIRLSIWGTILAVLLGASAGVLRTTSSLFNRLLGRTYVELIRNLPPLVLIFIFYYFVSDQIMPVFGVDEFIRSRSPETQRWLAFFIAPPEYFSAFLSAVVTIGVFEGAYITEIVRAGIQSIEKGQWEASYALGLSWSQQMRWIILPQAVKRVLPPLANQFISTIKDSAIVSVISIQELTFQGMELMAATQLTFEVWLTITAMYLVMTLTLSLGVTRLENRLARSEG